MNRFVFIIILFFFTGCTQAKQLAHLDQLLVIKGMSDNRDEQFKSVDEQNKKFEQLLEVVKNNWLNKYPDKKSILSSFGPPIFSRSVVDEGQPREEWLYRYATKYFNTDKIYLYFDGKGNLIRGDRVVAPPEKWRAMRRLPQKLNNMVIRLTAVLRREIKLRSRRATAMKRISILNNRVANAV